MEHTATNILPPMTTLCGMCKPQPSEISAAVMPTRNITAPTHDRKMTMATKSRLNSARAALVEYYARD